MNGSRVSVPMNLGGGLRLQWNLLRPIITNAIAYHTAIPFRVVANAPAGRDAQDQALIDTVYANHVLRHQRMNRKVQEALFLASAYGHCPIHAMWRDDLSTDWYEPLYNTENPEYGQAIRGGFVDYYVGDPWDTVYTSGATIDGVYGYTYGRVLPADLVRQAFPHIQGLEGRDNLPSASRFQRTARKWTQQNSTHGSATISGSSAADELLALVCREILPNVDPRYPDGALQIVAMSGAADTDDGFRGAGTPTLLHDGPLPGNRPSATRFYMDIRADDVLGKPFLADLDDLQVQLNQYVTDQAEWARRFNRPPLWVNGEYEIEDDSSIYDDDVVIQTHMQGSTAQFLYPPTAANSPYKWLIEATMEQMWRIGGYQAASRGEKNAGDPAAALVFMAKADDTVFGPVNRSIQDALCESVQTGHALFKTFGTAPMLVSIAGDEFGYLADSWIESDQLSEEPPQFDVVSGFGATLEARAQQLLNLAQTKGADGEPVLFTRQLRKLFPDKSLLPQETDIVEVRERRANAANHLIRQLAGQAQQQIQQMQEMVQQVPPEWQQQAQMQMQQAAQMIPQQIEQQVFQQFPMEYTDVPQVHIDILDELIQDPSESDMVKTIARVRQQRYVQRAFQIWESQAGHAQPQQGSPQGGPSVRGQVVMPENPTNPGTSVEQLTAEAQSAA